MDRRHFLTSLLGGAIAAHELDMEKLLWVPGEKKIFIPPPPIHWVTISYGLPSGYTPEPYVERMTKEEFLRRYVHNRFYRPGEFVTIEKGRAIWMASYDPVDHKPPDRFREAMLLTLESPDSAGA